MPTILRRRVWIPRSPSILLSIYNVGIGAVFDAGIRKGRKLNKKRTGLAHILKTKKFQMKVYLWLLWRLLLLWVSINALCTCACCWAWTTRMTSTLRTCAIASFAIVHPENTHFLCMGQYNCVYDSPPVLLAWNELLCFVKFNNRFTFVPFDFYRIPTGSPTGSSGTGCCCQCCLWVKSLSKMWQRHPVEKV